MPNNRSFGETLRSSLAGSAIQGSELASANHGSGFLSHDELPSMRARSPLGGNVAGFAASASISRRTELPVTGSRELVEV